VEDSSSGETQDVDDARGSDRSSASLGDKGLWISSGSEDHQLNSPMFKRRSGLIESDNVVKLGDEEIFGRVMMRSRMSLPNSKGGIASFHVLVNEERTKKGVAPLARNRTLDDFAREKAKAMAELGQLCHADPVEIQKAFGKASSRLGSNVARGSSVSEIHEAMKRSISDINNVRDRRFTLIGVGTAKGEDGKLYLCQIFRG
jgi:hypothetical protein